MRLITLSTELLNTVRKGLCSREKLKQLEKITVAELEQLLSSDKQKKAFWINLYNSMVIQRILEEGEIGNGFFSDKSVKFEDCYLSLDDIEHGILRKSKVKASLGYVNKKTIKDWELSLRVDELDPRLHFALNCGANSCPSIIIYTLENLDEELDSASRNYLKSSTFISPCLEKIKAPRIMLWYMGDFGGIRGIKKMYHQYGIIPPDVSPKLTFLDYDWSVNIENFA